MKISAVIPTYNRRETLKGCIDSLLDQDLAKNNYEIVVVVDGSSDGTVEMLRSLKPAVDLVVVEQENKGKSAALNAGMRAATSEIVLIIDDDLLCDRALLSSHLAWHEPNSRRLIFGRLLPGPHPSQRLAEQIIRKGLDDYYARLSSDPQIKWPEDAWAGPNCSMARSAFFEAGGSDERNFPRRAEDSDLGLRLWKIGVQFQYEPKATVTHRWVKSNRRYLAECIEDGASLYRLSRKYPETRRFWGFGGLAMAPMWKLKGAKLVCWNSTVLNCTLGFAMAVAERLAASGSKREMGMKIFFSCASLAGLAGARREAGSWRELMRVYGRRLPVLLYHHIGTPTAWTTTNSLTVTPEKFKRQMRWLRWRGYTGITSSQWLAWCKDGGPLPKKPVLITFDDAYAETAEHAFPVLEQYGHRAVVFVITGLMREGGTWEEQAVTTPKQVQEWAARGIEFGGHTRTHPDLTAESADRVASEVSGSREDLERIGVNPVSFAYPFGCFNKQVQQAVNGVFSIAFTCEEGVNDLRTDPLLMKRTMVVQKDTVLDLELRLAYGRSWFSTLRARLGIRTRILRAWESLSSGSKPNQSSMPGKSNE